jgi:hypothetical protein
MGAQRIRTLQGHAANQAQGRANYMTRCGQQRTCQQRCLERPEEAVTCESTSRSWLAHILPNHGPKPASKPPQRTVINKCLAGTCCSLDEQQHRGRGGGACRKKQLSRTPQSPTAILPPRYACSTLSRAASIPTTTTLQAGFNNHHYAGRHTLHTQKQRKALATQPTGAEVCSAVTREIYRCMVHKGQLRYYVTNGRCVLMFAPLWMARFNPVLRSLHPVCQPAFQPGTRTT